MHEPRIPPETPGGPPEPPAPPAPGSPVPVTPAPAGLPHIEEVPLAAPAATEAAAGHPTDKRRRGPKKVRPHPYANEASPPEELRLSPGKAFAVWAGAAIVLIGGGYLLASRYSPFVPGATHPLEDWELLLDIPLFLGIGLLGFGFSDKPWARRLTMLGWLVGAFYGGLWAQDLFYAEASDYVNYAFSILFGILFVYLAYHEWLSLLRGVTNASVRFLSVSFFVGAGAYFLIDKIQSVRLWLIHVVSGQTKWMLDLFGQGDKAGLQFIVDKADPKSPTTFFYPDQYCEPFATNEDGSRSEVGRYCAEHNLYVPQHDATIPDTWWGQILHFAPDGDHRILPVSIVLACTALQSIMVFIGLFAGTTASFRRKVYASVIVGGIVYVLNLVRNTGIIWFYGQGHSSFWVMHDAIGKGGSLIAMIAIAFGVFRYFPEFLQALFGVLDLIERDGPIERFLKVGRRRPAASARPGP
ncbi:MAG: archaeosortase [Thermoplasmata archaeon]|nr:archaeosortase [Thermoplasmata archaeon]